MSRGMPTRPLVAAALAAATFAVHAMPRHVEIALRPGGIHEDCFALRVGQRVRYNFTLDRPGSFNLHFHRGKDVLYPLRSESVREQKGDYTAESAEEFCLMWTGGKAGDTKLGYEFEVLEPGLTR